jgi:hypothetical protein
MPIAEQGSPVMKLNHREVAILCSVSIIALASLSAFATLTAFAGTATAQDQLLWGDTHLHSSNSFDAYLTGNMTAGPDTAYRFAKGLPVVHPCLSSESIRVAISYVVSRNPTQMNLIDHDYMVNKLASA